jgi:hypothetical protein
VHTEANRVSFEEPKKLTIEDKLKMAEQAEDIIDWE